METAATLILRKVLNPSDPVHQAIIKDSQPPEEQEGRGGASTAAAGSASDVVSSPKGLKRIKLEPTRINRPVKQNVFPGAKKQLSSQQPEIIDLT